MEVTSIRWKSQMVALSFILHGRNHAPRIKSLGTATTKKKLILWEQLLHTPEHEHRHWNDKFFSFFVPMHNRRKAKKKKMLERSCAQFILIKPVQACRHSLTFVLCQPALPLPHLLVIKLTRQTSTIIIPCQLQKHCSSTTMIRVSFWLGRLSACSPPPPPRDCGYHSTAW